MNLPEPLLQIGFAAQLEVARTTILGDALRATVGELSAKILDAELALYVPDDALTALASFGLRGEALFPVPAILIAKPSLLGYYRLVYGYSQKQFYTSASGGAAFGIMERRGKLSPAAETRLAELCEAFADVGSVLVRGLGSKIGTLGLLNELALLTLGPQFRGGANNRRGADGILAVFELFRSIVADDIVDADDRSLKVRNAAGKIVTIAIAADPDIMITAPIDAKLMRPIVAIEVKAGEDHSNIWNRLGEAEKSHQKAKGDGVTECWTIINDAKAASDKLARASPTTNRFYQLLDIINPETEAHDEFRLRVRSLIGLA